MLMVLAFLTSPSMLIVHGRGLNSAGMNSWVSFIGAEFVIIVISRHILIFGEFFARAISGFCVVGDFLTR